MTRKAMDSSLPTEAARTCSSTTPRSKWRGSAASRKARRWSTRSPKVPRGRRRRTSGRSENRFRNHTTTPPGATSPGGFVLDLLQVPEEVQTHAVSTGDIVGQPGRVGNLVPVQEQLGAQRKPRRHARVVRESAGERQPGRRRVGPVISVVVIDPTHANPSVEAEPVAGAIAHQHRLSPDGESPRGEVEALRVSARVHSEVHE